MRYQNGRILSLYLVFFTLVYFGISCFRIMNIEAADNVKLINNDACFYFSRTDGTITGISYPSDGDICGNESMTGFITILDGKAKREVSFSDGQLKEEKGYLVCTKESTDGLNLIQKIDSSSNKISFVLELTNNGKNQRWLEPSLCVSKRICGEWQYWNGREVLGGSKGFTDQNNEMYGMFPLMALFSGTEGIALGVEPLQLLSYINCSARSNDGESVDAAYSTRVVLDPGQSAAIEFILFAFAPHQKVASAVQKYQDTYPAVFKAHPDIDRRISLNSAEYMAVNYLNTEEVCKRSYAGWDWWYTPYKRSGEIYGHPELWDFEIANPPIRNISTGTVEEFHQRRIEIRDRALGNGGVLPLFYIPAGKWAEEQLVNEYYPEAKVVDNRLQNYMRAYTTPHTNDVRVFSYGNDYADALRRDMKLVTEELGLGGFAFDTATGDIKIYQGSVKGVEQIPIRAYDEKGIFVVEGVTIALLADYVHTLKNSEGKNLGVAMNSGPTYMTLFRADATLHEGTPWMRIRKGDDFVKRYMLGQKTCVWWKNWDFGDILAKNLSAIEREEAFDGMQDQMIMRSITWAMLPPAQFLFTSRGGPLAPKLENTLPLMIELMQTGFQPVSGLLEIKQPPLERGEIWSCRYQDDEKIFIVVANASLDEIDEPFIVNNRLLGDYTYVFVDYNGAPTKNIIKGFKTGLEFPLKSREYLVARSVLGIQKFDKNLQLELLVNKDDTLGITRIEFNSSSVISSSFIVPIPEGYNLANIYLNGRKLNSVLLEPNKYVFEATISPRDVLEIKVELKQ